MAAAAVSSGGNINSVPAPAKQTLSSAYIDFTAAGTAGWAQQHLPDLMEQEAAVFGKRTISGFLNQVGAEEAMTSDQVIWSEQGRLHINLAATVTTKGAGLVTFASAHELRVGDTVIIHETGGGNLKLNCYVSAIPSTTTANLLPYTQANLGSSGQAFLDNDAVTVFVYGSEFAKGTVGQTEAIAPTFKSFTNKPIIIKDMYEISGSDASQIGWVEVTGESGQSGYLWYLKAEGDTRSRFTDQLEMTMVEAEKSVAAAGAAVPDGTEGMFAAIADRGHFSAGIVGSSAADDLGSFDNILKKFDANGAIEENMIYANRSVSLAIDDMLAAQNSYGTGGTSYGVFSNSEDMALNLGFSGFRRGSYDFYKSDWKYLNDLGTRGVYGDTSIRGAIIPAGVSSVYDEQLGSSMKRPFLHVRYRSSQTDDRKMKTWVTGSVGGNVTSDLDAMKVHYLSERCLVVQGANNFCLLN
tara:strand:+ start:1717 stop:3120 length:1404 start_codon:yes stop_codon:yes gene_type:complete